MADDPIKAFLETSGLTPEDLIRRLAQYQNNSETVLEEIVQVKREPSSPVHSPNAFTETILISDSDDDDDDSRREPERFEICESDDEVVENKSKVEELDSGRLKRRLSEVEDAVPKKSRRRSEEDKFELYEGNDLDTFILKNRLDDIFEDSSARTEDNSPRRRVSIDLISNETGESEVVGNSTSIDESTKSASPSQDSDSLNKIVTQVAEQNPQKTCNEEESTISEVRCEAGEVTQNEKCTVSETKCDPRIFRLNRPQDEISKAADEVIVLDKTTSKTNDLLEEVDVTVATKENRNNYSETVDKVIDLDKTTVKTNDLSKEADVNTATKECRSDDSEKIVDVTEEIEAVKENEDSSCLDNVLDSLLRLVDDDDSGKRTKVTSDNVETTGQSLSNITETDVLRIKIDEEVVQNDKDECLDECTRRYVEKQTEVESIVQKDKETIASVDSVDKEVVQKDQNESATVKMDVLIDKCVDVALEHENLDSSDLHLRKNPQKIVDLTVSSDSSDLEVEKVKDLPSKDGLFDDKLDEPRKVETADAFGDVDSLKDVFNAEKIKDSSDSDVFEDTKESPGEPHKDKYMNVDLQKVEDTTASSNLNVFQHTNKDSKVDLSSCTHLNAEKIDETSSTSSDLDIFGDVIDRIRKVDSQKDDGSSSLNSDLHNLVKEVDSSTDSSGDGDVFEKQYRARLKDPRILRREIEKYDAWCTENAKFDKFSFIKSDFNDGEASTDIVDVDKVECNGKTDDSEDVELITKDVEVIDVDEIEEKSDVGAGRSDDPGEFVKLEVEEDAVERTEDDGSNVKDFHDDINDGSKTELSGRSSPSLSTLELNSDISDVDVDVENNRVEAESSVGYVDEAETVDLTFEHSTEKKLPTVGTIRKSVGKRTARVFRPPWLKFEDVVEQDVASDVAEPQVELRPKPLGPLVDIRTSIPETYHKRRTKTPEPPAEPSLFDIKIVDVKSGADVDIRTAIAQIRDRRRRDDVINEELKGDVITLTKTSDFTKIKGWRRKKLLIKSETDIDVDYGEVDNVFASDNLDGFLDRQKNLNISYNVPNLKSSNHSNVDYLDGTVIMHDSSADEKGRFESRRRFTMAENEQVSCINQNAKMDPFKPRTLAEKRKLLSREVKPEPPTSHSLVYYRGKAFKVPSKYEKNITVHGENRTKYRYTYTSAKPLKKTKPSIYTTNLSRTVAIKYKPGPMSKKQVLDSNWTPVVKKLPRVRLCVVPEYRVPLHPRAAQFVKFETFEVTSERVEFALGALPGKGAGTCFDVPYKNDQKTVLLLKAAEVVAPEVKPEPAPVKVEEENVEDVVRKMLGDMVDYVELKEIGESIVEEDHSYEPQAKETSPTKPGAKRSSRTEVIKGSTKKTNLELKRLNVKIIEVNIEDGADDGVGCTKSHCRLGCVCKSLRAPVFPQDHCGKRQCIFGCVCGFERSRNRRMKFVLPSGTDILSETTVSRLQDEAKKNLAKVEKEFTQTVIHANNQTIVVGEKTDRKRRPLKTPKKYEDYIEPVVLGEEDQQQDAATVSPMKPIVVELPRKRKRSPPPPETTVIPCRVVVHKLDLEHVLPLCLEHNLYDCHCGGRDSYSKTAASVSLVRPTTSVSLKRPTPSTTPVDDGKEVGEKAERKKVIREKREKDSDWCSRTKGAPYSIVQRNRTVKYKKTLAHKLRRSENADAHSLDISARWLKDPVDDVVEQIAIVDNAGEPENGGMRGRKKKRRKMPELIPIKEDTTAQIDQDPLLEPLGTGSLESTKPSRRKQILMTREQMGEMMKKKAVEEKAKAKAAKWKALCEPQPSQQPPKQQPPKQQPQPQQQQVLGEAVVPLHSDLNQKVKDLLGNSNDVLRIIPWRLLLQKYLSGTIEIWCWPAFQKFVLTDPKVFLTKAWLNVRQHEADAGTCEMRDLDFFKWIVDRRTNDESQSVFIILQKTSACWEVRGVVRKSGAGSSVLKSSRPETTTTISPTQTTESATTEGEMTESLTNQPEMTQSAIEPTSTESETTETETTTEPARSQSPSTIDEVTRKTQEYVGEANQQYKQVPHLDILTRMFRFQLLRSEEHGDYEVRLPRVHGGARWRMLQVSNFSHLAFKRNSYRIKATNIMVAMKEAQKTGKTAILLNEYIRKNYGSMIFGVYACCFQLNKVFIGPYGMDEDHDLETLRFVNNVLVNTDVVDKMRNAGGQSTNGCWFVQVVLKKKKNTDQPAEAPAAVTHKMNESEYALLSTFDAAATMFTDTLKSLMTAARLRLPHSAVPLALKANFDDGFIHAFKYPGHDAIFVYWPGGRLDEPQKFDTKDVALEWVVGNLMKTFVAVPNFTITAKFVKVSDFVENSTCSTMSRNYFDELHIVGPFGAVRMVNVADYLIHPEKKHPPELVDVINEFCLGSDGLSKTDFLESMLVQTKADVSVELTKSSKLGDEKRNLEKKRNDLLLKIKALKPALKTNPVVSSQEVICLDSDDETTTTEAPKTTVTPQSPTKSFTKLSDALQQTTDPVKVRNNVVLYQMKGGAQLTRKTYPSPASKPRKMPTIKSVRPMQPFAEKIDLSHLDPAKVQRLLGSTDLTSGRVLLTGEQLRNLRALSKVKVAVTPTTETTSDLRKVKTSTTEMASTEMTSTETDT